MEDGNRLRIPKQSGSKGLYRTVGKVEEQDNGAVGRQKIISTRGHEVQRSGRRRSLYFSHGDDSLRRSAWTNNSPKCPTVRFTQCCNLSPWTKGDSLWYTSTGDQFTSKNKKWARWPISDFLIQCFRQQIFSLEIRILLPLNYSPIKLYNMKSKTKIMTNKYRIYLWCISLKAARKENAIRKSQCSEEQICYNFTRS